MTDTELHPVGLNLGIPQALETSATIGSLDVDLEIALREGQYVCARFEARPKVEHRDAGVTGESLREVALGELIEGATRDPSVEATIRSTGRRIIEEEGGLTAGSLEVVATAYRYGYAVSDSPTREVVDLLGLSRSKASRWIAEAREEGLLAETRERQASGVPLGVEADLNRLASLRDELLLAENRAKRYREEFEEVERRVTGSLAAQFLGSQDRIADQRRERLDREYDRIALLERAIADIKQRLAESGE